MGVLTSAIACISSKYLRSAKWTMEITSTVAFVESERYDTKAVWSSNLLSPTRCSLSRWESGRPLSGATRRSIHLIKRCGCSPPGEGFARIFLPLTAFLATSVSHESLWRPPCMSTGK